MHIPDGFLDPLWSIATYGVTIAYFASVLKILKKMFSPEKVSLLTVLAAGIFAAQMLNWPLPGGTSLHFVGGALAGIMLGPVYGSLVLALVVTVQCLIFHDGGITALGANLLNMAIVDVIIGYVVYRAIVKAMGLSNKSRFIGGLLGGWLGITLAGITCGIEIGFSPQFPCGVTITVPVMGSWHALLGIIEGVITGLIIVYIASKNPEIILADNVKKQ